MDIPKMFYSSRNEEQSESIEKHMKNIFPFLGLKKLVIASLSKELL